MPVKEHRRPYRIVVFASGVAPATQSKHPRANPAIQLRQYAYHGWNPVQHYNEARLPSAGSFLYPGIIAVRAAAMEYLALPETQQVSIRTNQDQRVYRYFKQADGTISGYMDDKE